MSRLCVLLIAVLGSSVQGWCAGDTLTVIQRPLLNIPAIVRAGDTLNIQCEAPSGTSNWAAELIHGKSLVPLAVLESTYDPSTLWWDLKARVPAVRLYELYDLAVAASGGTQDTTRNAVRVIPEFKNDYYFVHITDPHLPTHRYYYEAGAETDSSSMVDLREVIKDVNIINPEFVLLTGDLVNEGELEDYLDRHYFSRAQRLLTEFQVPVYLTAGNHDLGGWYATPPPDGTARRTWWRFFGWQRLSSPPSGAPWYTQDYSFDYGPVHYVGLEAYINYDMWRSDIYGGQSFTQAQMNWLAGDLAAASGSLARVLFYHYDFSRQINPGSLGIQMTLAGHTHSDENDFLPPYNIITRSVCDGNRAYRLVRVSGGVLHPSFTMTAGSTGANLNVTYAPANDGTNSSVTANITNNLPEHFEHSQLRFVMPAQKGYYDVAGGTLLQVDDSGPNRVCYVGVDILASSSQTVSITLDTTDREAPQVTVTSPNGGEIWDAGSAHVIAWTASDDIGVTSVSIVLSLDGGLTFSDTLATEAGDESTYTWTVNADPTTAARIKVIARDGADHTGEDTGNGDFEIRQAATSVPGTLVIAGTAPNPFSGHATIRFGLPRDGVAEIDLYDVAGHFVMNLVRSPYSAGYHEIGWDTGNAVGAGVYILRLKLGRDTATAKTVIPG
ncbi:MAG TPA: metallophosphoesterase [bacterium]|nr:metallophosphoesterase [bacterium]